MWNGLDTRQLYKDRIEVAVDLWDKILRGQITSRTQLEEQLYIMYKQRGIEPFRGFSKIRIYDKEIATVYVVGRYGLGFGDDIINATKHIFNVEYRCDKAYTLLKNNGFQNISEIKYEVRELIDSNILGLGLEDRVFRFMRYVFTGTILEFFEEQEFIKTYNVLKEIFSELGDKLIRYVKFYVAFKVAELIALGQVKDPIEKKIFKYAQCVRINVPMCSPSDALIREVALRVYKVPKKVLDKLFPNVSSKSPIPNASSR